MFVEVFYDKGSKATFYTVRKLNSEISETQDFLERISNTPYKGKLYSVISLLTNEIGDKYGAHQKYFSRNERMAIAFPPRPYKPFEGETVKNFSYSPIRLYALRVSDSIIVLFNGGLKFTKGSAQNDPNINMYFYQANDYAQRILKAIEDETICLSFKSMVNFDGTKNIII